MGEPSSGTHSPAGRLEERLDSWKEIAAYLNRDVTTVQRWEKREGMPVYRHQHDRMGSVYAFRSELDAWALSRNLPAGQGNGKSVPSLETPAPPPGVGTSNPRTRWKAIVGLTLAVAVVAIGAIVRLRKTEYFWQNPLTNVRFQTVTDFDGVAQAAAVSRDGQFVAFLSDRDGQMDVWVTQIGSGQLHNLTHGGMPEVVNPSVRTLGFSPDGSMVTFWVRKQGSSGGDINIWAVPTLGSRSRTLKAWLNSTGRMTARGLRITRLGREIRCL